jgi:hypothetical protein
MTSTSPTPFRYSVAKTYRPRGPLQQHRLASATSFSCSRCGTAKTSRLITTIDGDWDRLLCNGCYGRLLSIWEIKAGALADEDRDTALLETLTGGVPADAVARAQTRLLAAGNQHAQLSDEAQRMLATGYAVTTALRAATRLDWSVAVIALCKAVERGQYVESLNRSERSLPAATWPPICRTETSRWSLGTVPARAGRLHSGRSHGFYASRRVPSNEPRPAPHRRSACNRHRVAIRGLALCTKRLP